MTAWKAKEEAGDARRPNGGGDFDDMMAFLWKLVEGGQLRPPKYKFAALGDFRTAVAEAMPEGGRGNEKVIFKF